ncbi:MAG: YggS family pyridoxal phosphate-dependent enzyme [Candidatus Marinimicrobia bacterium]|nr:YggS family pyridoxal phosphate-dependent enzyme [Candidatus Neomarinimicrobiota bacterium]
MEPIYVDKIDTIKKNIQKYSKHSENVKLIGVTKTFPIDVMLNGIDSGLDTIGENKIQDAISKFEKESFPGIERHYIGKLQSNKVKKVVENFDYVHSLDREKIVRKIDNLETKIKCLIEVNTSGEENKGGVEPAELEKFILQIQKYKNIQIIGLMTISPLTKDENKIRNSFKQLKELAEFNKKNETENIKFDKLSMGMTNDYKIALEEGATMIRIGRGIFGERK